MQKSTMHSTYPTSSFQGFGAFGFYKISPVSWKEVGLNRFDWTKNKPLPAAGYMPPIYSDDDAMIPPTEITKKIFYLINYLYVVVVFHFVVVVFQRSVQGRKTTDSRSVKILLTTHTNKKAKIVFTILETESTASREISKLGEVGGGLPFWIHSQPNASAKLLRRITQINAPDLYTLIRIHYTSSDYTAVISAEIA